jgi:hypothetical protein
VHRPSTAGAEKSAQGLRVVAFAATRAGATMELALIARIISLLCRARNFCVSGGVSVAARFWPAACKTLVATTESDMQ